ncbi:hypothetical protein M758_2G085700 [Ceratodon purpureus]|nr:hypothetical protein M758_2G085700 [Ceratodon purpureus]
MTSLSLRAGAVVAQTEMATLVDCTRGGSCLMRQECLVSSTSATPSQRLACTGRLSVAGASPSRASSLASQLAAGALGLAQKQSRASQVGRPWAASGSVQQQEEEIAAVGTITVGQFVVQGLREEMEDEIVVEADGPNGFSFAAIFDGHAGGYSAKFLRDELYKECLAALEGGTLLESDNLHEAEEALSRAFLETDKRLVSRLETRDLVEEAESGSTGTVLFARSDRLVLAYVGDSRAVLSRNGKAQDLTADHRPFGRDKKSFLEIKRIQEAGGWVSHGRVCGMLSVSRAFGDIPFKTRKQQMLDRGVADRSWPKSFANMRSRNLNGEWLTATPDTSSMLVEEEVEFIILASDGLWDSLKSGEAVDFVRKQLNEHGNVQRACEEIAQEALNRGGQDNVSVIIVDFGRTVIGDEEPGWKFW